MNATNQTPALETVASLRKPKGNFRLFLEAFLGDKLGIIGLAFLVFITLFCFVGPLLYHTDQINTSYSVYLPPGSPGHPLGTDEVGFDELGRLMVGGQPALIIGFAAAFLATTFGAIWGAIAGYFGGVVDAVMMRIVDTLLSVPSLFLLLVIASMMKISVPLMILIVALVAWLVPSRLIRGETLSLVSREYVQSVRMMGGSSLRAIFLHIIPNTIGTIMVNASFQIADAILLISALSYLGIGIPPNIPTWGGMLATGTNFVLAGYWWLIYFPGAAIVLTIVAFNFVGDALRSALEQRIQ